MATSVKNNTISIDAAGETLGRLAARVAVILREKDTAGYAPNRMPTRKVVVFNTDQIAVSGTKRDSKIYYRHSGYPGGITAEDLGTLLEKDSREVIRRAVYGMLPNNRLRDRIITHLTLYRREAK